MFSKSDTDFIDFLFGKLTCLDTDMIDLHDDDTAGIDELELEKRAADLEMTVDEMLHADLWLTLLTKTMSTISEVMLDRWLLEQIEEEYDVMEVERDMPREELSYEALELLSWALY